MNSYKTRIEKLENQKNPQKPWTLEDAITAQEEGRPFPPRRELTEEELGEII